MNNYRTSQTHPINLQIIQDVWPGKLAITFAPGKTQQNALTGKWKRNLLKDLDRIKNHYKMDGLVCLLQQDQMKELKIPNLLTQCKKIGLFTQRIQVTDNTVCQEQQDYKNLVKKVVDEYLSKGKNIVVHCKGGLGRAGTFAATCLIYSKYKPQDAIKLVRKVRNHSINCYEQEEWLLKKLKF